MAAMFKAKLMILRKIKDGVYTMDRLTVGIERNRRESYLM